MEILSRQRILARREERTFNIVFEFIQMFRGGGIPWGNRLERERGGKRRNSSKFHLLTVMTFHGSYSRFTNQTGQVVSESGTDSFLMSAV